MRGKKRLEKKEPEKKLEARTNNIGTHATRETKVMSTFIKHNAACQCVYSSFSLL